MTVWYTIKNNVIEVKKEGEKLTMAIDEKAKAKFAEIRLRQKADRDYRRQVEAELALLPSCKQCGNCVNDCKQDNRVLSVSCLKKRVKK